jgi:YidC/Oxa1 family membrane protein insertase
MKFDRNTVLGFVVLAALFFGYFYFIRQDEATMRKNRAIEQAYNDSVARANAPKLDSTVARIDSIHTDSLNRIAKEGMFHGAGTGTEQIIYAQNNVFKISSRIWTVDVFAWQLPNLIISVIPLILPITR